MATVASETPEPSIAYRLHASELIANPLFDAIPRRRTNRLSYRDEPVAPGQLRELADLASGPDLRVVVVTDRSARDELGAIIVRATERIVADPEMSMDSFG